MANDILFDFEWFRKLLIDDLGPHWLKGAVTDSGLFHAPMDRHWNRISDGEGGLVSQSRLLFVFAEAYRQTGDERYIQAVKQGADYLMEHFQDREYGGYYLGCAPDGTITDDRKRSYGHVFVIFGLAHAYEVTGEQRFLQGAFDAGETIHTKFRDNHGGICQMMTRDFVDQDRHRNQNPVMHLTEALLTLAEISGEKKYLEMAREWIDFLFIPTFERKDIALLEFYDFKWQPLTDEDLADSEPGMIVIGHQLEWAFLLSRAVEMGLPETYLEHAEFVLKSGLDIGFDTDYGGLMTGATKEGKLAKDHKGFWEQTETIRTLLNFVVRHERRDLEPVLDKAVEFFRRYQYDSEFGGIFPSLTREGSVVQDNKGGLYKLDYHTIAMIQEVLRLEEIQKA